jgi:putative endonuclease
MMADHHEKHQAAERRGHHGESLAALWLRLKTRAGKIDLVAAAVFGPVRCIEVKARQKARMAAESVARAQQTRIARAACLYLAGRPWLARRGARFDIVAIGTGALPVHHRDVWRADL